MMMWLILWVEGSLLFGVVLARIGWDHNNDG